jgi:hypothetical protein
MSPREFAALASYFTLRTKMFAPWSKQSEELKGADPGLDLASAEIKAAWAARMGLVETAEYPDWRLLLRPQAAFAMLRPQAAFATPEDLVVRGAELPPGLPADDHGSLWERGGRPVVWASQPLRAQPGAAGDARCGPPLWAFVRGHGGSRLAQSLWLPAGAVAGEILCREDVNTQADSNMFETTDSDSGSPAEIVAVI